MKQQGFTLLEVLVALAIAATALVVMVGRVGASADLHRDLSLHALALDVAVNVLEGNRLKKSLAASGEDGEVKISDTTIQWRISVEKASVDGFVRQNIEVSASGEPPVKLFLYRAVP